MGFEAGAGLLLAEKSSEDRWRTILRWQKLGVIGLSGLAVLLFLLTALRRLHYPFELDRMESAMMTTVWRVVHGMPVYVRPSLEWAPFLYAPFFFYCSAAMTRVTGVGYAALRSVSILSTLGSCVVLGSMVYRETRNRTAAIATVGLFAMLYSLVLSWYDIGRVDSLSVFLFLLAVYCMRFTSPVLAALVWMLAFQTKQGFLPIAFLAFLVDWQRPKRMVLGLVSEAVFAFGSIWWLNHASDGWYRYYVFGSVKKIGFSARYGAWFVPYDLLQPLGLALGLVLFALVLRPVAWRSRRVSFYALFTAILTAGIWFARAHEGSYYNTLIPLYAWICVLFGLALHRLTTGWERGDGAVSTLSASSGSTLPLAFSVLIWLVAFLQIAQHLYRPGAFGRSAQEAQIRWDFIHRLQATPGDVWVVNHSYDEILAGKGLHAEMDAFDAVLGREDGPSIAEVRRAYREHRFTAVILDRSPGTYSPEWLFGGAEFKDQYPLRALAPGAGPPEVGDQPVMVFVSCSVQPSAASALNLNATYVQQGDCAR